MSQDKLFDFERNFVYNHEIKNNKKEVNGAIISFSFTKINKSNLISFRYENYLYENKINVYCAKTKCKFTDIKTGKNLYDILIIDQNKFAITRFYNIKEIASSKMIFCAYEEFNKDCPLHPIMVN
ncbi:MAG: hypothetical protein SFU98_21770 [Leptospiraceae bacterium]|nr:hypothetical protein [Leptospiraceae bacterium]